MSEVFKDVTENGKVRPWRERKIENVRYAEYLSILEFMSALQLEKEHEKLEPIKTNYCGSSCKRA